jgi:putative CocE/NonD family hydrolase
MPRIEVDKNVEVSMRDGVTLMADIYRPEGRERLPVLLQRTPYDKEITAFTILPADVFRLVQAGYVVVVQDTRGRYASPGTFEPFVDEAADGEDTIAWVRRQPWSSGVVGMFGQSYVGATQWLAASTRPQGLGAIAPGLSAAEYHSGWTYRGGAFELGFCLLWTLMSLAPGEVVRRRNSDPLNLVSSVDRIEELYRRLPLIEVPEIEELAPYYREWLTHPDDGPYWDRIAPLRRIERGTAPALVAGGWYDIFLGGTLASYIAMSRAGITGTRLVVGPWAHGVTGGTFVERSYGLGASSDALDITGLQIAWFDHWLKGAGDGLDQKPVRLFVMGANEWRDEEDWPLPDTSFTSYYLRSSGSANTLAGDGALSTEPPGEESADVYVYDPRDPVPTVGGATFLPGVWLGVNAGPRDQRPVEARRDVLCYTSEPLERQLEVVGPVSLVLYASSSALDTDFAAKLVDVAADGRAELLTDGILRARYRDSASAPSLLTPGRVEEFRIDLGATAYVFPTGHRIRLEVTSSSFPRFARNMNTGTTIAFERLEEAVPATNRIHHERAYPSHVVLPVIDRL